MARWRRKRATTGRDQSPNRSPKGRGGIAGTFLSCVTSSGRAEHRKRFPRGADASAREAGLVRRSELHLGHRDSQPSKRGACRPMPTPQGLNRGQMRKKWISSGHGEAAPPLHLKVGRRRCRPPSVWLWRKWKNQSERSVWLLAKRGASPGKRDATHVVERTAEKSSTGNVARCSAPGRVC